MFKFTFDKMLEISACYRWKSKKILAIVTKYGRFAKRVTLELQVSFQFVASVKVKAYFLEAPMNVSGEVQGQMGGSFIIKKFYPLYLFFSQGLSGVAQRQIGGSFIRKKLCPLHLFFFDCYG